MLQSKSLLLFLLDFCLNIIDLLLTVNFTYLLITGKASELIKTFLFSTFALSVLFLIKFWSQWLLEYISWGKYSLTDIFSVIVHSYSSWLIVVYYILLFCWVVSQVSEGLSNILKCLIEFIFIWWSCSNWGVTSETVESMILRSVTYLLGL